MDSGGLLYTKITQTFTDGATVRSFCWDVRASAACR